MKIAIQTRDLPLAEARRDELRAHAEERVRFALGSASARVRSLTVRLAAAARPAEGAQPCCTIRAVIAGHPPLVVEQRESDLLIAIDRAADRIGRTVSRRLESPAGRDAGRRTPAP